MTASICSGSCAVQPVQRWNWKARKCQLVPAPSACNSMSFVTRLAKSPCALGTQHSDQSFAVKSPKPQNYFGTKFKESWQRDRRTLQILNAASSETVAAMRTRKTCRTSWMSWIIRNFTGSHSPLQGFAEGRKQSSSQAWAKNQLVRWGGPEVRCLGLRWCSRQSRRQSHRSSSPYGDLQVCLPRPPETSKDVGPATMSSVSTESGFVS